MLKQRSTGINPQRAVTCSSPSKTPTDAKTVGFIGELYVWEIFEAEIPGWDIKAWTSRNRNGIPGPKFCGKEKDYADITYTDSDGFMASVLCLHGYKEVSAVQYVLPSRPITYHIEVKASKSDSKSQFKLSQSQMEKAQRYALPDLGTGTPKDIYIIARVHNFERHSFGVHFFIDPWSQLRTGALMKTETIQYLLRPLLPPQYVEIGEAFDDDGDGGDTGNHEENDGDENRIEIMDLTGD